MNRPSVGATVHLRADVEEDWPRETAEVVGYDEREWGTCVTVRVVPDDRPPEDVDGVREVSLDQLEEYVP